MRDTLPGENSEKNDNVPLGFVGHVRVLELVYPDPLARPGLKWLQRQRQKRLIPFIKVGRRICYHPVAVRESLAKRFTVVPLEGK
jgi:hypothetical protein